MYIRFGPFTDGSASPPIDAALLNAVEAALAAANVYWAPAPSGGDDTTAVNALLAAVPDYATVIFTGGTYQTGNSTYGGPGFNVTHPLRLIGMGSTIAPVSGTAGGIGLISVNSSDVTIENFRFTGLSFVGEGIFLNQAFATTPIRDITIRGCRFDGCWTAVYALQQVTDVLIEGNQFYGGRYGVLVNDGDGLARWNITGNLFRGGRGGDAIEINGVSYARYDFTCVGNQIYDYQPDPADGTGGSDVGHGIAYSYVVGGTITGNTIRGCNRNGIHLEQFSQLVTISGNDIADIGTGGIEVQGNPGTCSRIVIEGNTITNAAQKSGVVGGGLSNGGIDLGARNATASTSDPQGANYVIVRNNIIHACRGTGIWAQYCAQSQIAGNIITNTYGVCNDTAVDHNAGIYVIGGASTLVTQNTVSDSRPGLESGSATQYHPLAFTSAASGLVVSNNIRVGNIGSDLNAPSGAS